MSKPWPADKLDEIERVVRAHPHGVSAPDIAAALTAHLPSRTLQDHLQRLVRDGRLVRQGSRRWARYRAPEPTATHTATVTSATDAAIPLTAEAAEIQRLVSQPETARQPVGYRRDFLEAYRPKESSYLSAAERTRLTEIARRPGGAAQPAGTYARHILNRLLIDLAWNSSRLEGN